MSHHRVFRIEVALRPDLPDPVGNQVIADLRERGERRIRSVRLVQICWIRGDIGSGGAGRVARELLADPVSERHAVDAPVLPVGGRHWIEIVRRPGVMDPVEESIRKGIADLGIFVEAVRTGRRYVVEGTAGPGDLRKLAERGFANPVIEEVLVDEALAAPFVSPPPVSQEVRVAPLRRASARKLLDISRRGGLALNLREMQAVQRHYRKLRREPTDIELETIAQTWSEHCVHKTLKGKIHFRGEVIDNLLASTIARATKKLAKPWCVSVFVDNSGVIRFDGKHDVCFKVETHNHPSAIEPYGGAGTGIGGVIRDILGTGLGAKPILNTDVFCFGPLDYPEKKVPKGILHPRRLFKGVVSGVRDYGNRMGIPTSSGAIYFDERYLGNPLVYCGTVGLLPRGLTEREAARGDLVVAMGGRTGRDGIHGATFSSEALHTKSETLSGGAVQIGNAITEKRVLDVLIQARDRRLYRAVTDCGAGGFSSAVGEMGRRLGVEVDLEKAPLKYAGLTYAEIWISEAQERMVLAVPPERWPALDALCRSEGVEAVVIGRFTGTGKLALRYAGRPVGELDMKFLHDGIPRFECRAVWNPPKTSEPVLREERDYNKALAAILASGNVASKEWVIRQYDHEVQGRSVLKPLIGAANDGPGDAVIISPVRGSNRGLVVACGMNPCYGDIDPYAMAASAIDEALRQVVAVGGDLDEVALLDNFSWGSTRDPENIGALVLACKACHDYSLAYGAPFISGKDSLNNEFRLGGKFISIPHSLLISSIAVMKDIRKAISMDAKRPGNLIYAVGLTKNELGGSHFHRLKGNLGRNAPQVDPVLGRNVLTTLARATARGLVRSAHDCSEGGLAVAAAEMAFAGDLGMRLDLNGLPRDGGVTRVYHALFSESNSRFLVEVEFGKRKAFERVMKDVPCAALGNVTAPRTLAMMWRGKTVLREDVRTLKKAWQGTVKG
ncbi:MAG: phosphoribosylformylglycinamidine synthase subunit PurL [Planctomycetota bacterium]